MTIHQLFLEFMQKCLREGIKISDIREKLEDYLYDEEEELSE